MDEKLENTNLNMCIKLVPDLKHETIYTQEKPRKEKHIENLNLRLYSEKVYHSLMPILHVSIINLEFKK
jgi:hypothetical protein